LDYGIVIVVGKEFRKFSPTTDLRVRKWWTMSSVELGFKAEARKALADFTEAKDLAKRAEALKKESEAKLRELLGDATEATFGGVIAFKLVDKSSSYIDSKKLAQDYPEAYEATRYTTEYDFVKIAV
jgi:predicted phage-related endonuclease